MNNGGQRATNAVTGTLLPADRPEPQTKKHRANRVNVRSAGMKRVIQSENPTEFKIDWSKCPKLASKFPHLHIERDLEHVGHTESSSSTTFEKSVSCEGVPDTTTNGPCASTKPPPVLVQSRRGFRYPNRGAVSNSGDHRSFLPTNGVFVRKAGESGSHCSEDDQRSNL